MALSKLDWVVLGLLATAGCDDGTDGLAGMPIGQTPGSQPSGDEEPAAPASCSEEHDERACTVAGGGQGTQFCEAPGYEEPLVWTTCVAMPACSPGEEADCGWDDPELEDLSDVCVVEDGVPAWGCDVDPEGCGCATPLVLAFDGEEPRMTATSAAFDLDVAGGCLSTDWPEASTPWLAIDRDGDGAIADGRELFGSGTRLRSGARAPHGFAALAELDDDGNGIVDARDAGFGKLVLWGDRDLDKRGTATELEQLGGRVLSLELDWHAERRCDARGNCGIERAAFTWIDRDGSLRTGTIVDVHLACQ